MDDDKPNHAAYWAAALARHKAYIAAGCISPVGALRMSSPPKPKDDDAEPERAE